ncbi:hypothetical protein MASR1M32_40070 [Rhodobacter sp.]
MARPETAAPEEPAAEAPVTLAAAEEVPAPAEEVVEELVAAPQPEETLLAEATEIPQVDAVETVAAVTSPAPEVVAEAEPAKPARNAPIFDSAEPEAIELASAEIPEEELVVVAKSTSGGRHYGVNVGDYTSRSQAERELLKVALVESATLNRGLRKITEKGGSYHANFMGLTEDQADLACRRLKARGVPCETIGQ